MSRLLEVRVPRYPECWASCGNCGSGEVRVDEVLVRPGDSVARDDVVVILETGKVALDIPSPAAGRVCELHVDAGETIGEGQSILTLELD